MSKPELKQFGELTARDFERHPVWIGAHGADEGEPWYEETNEETFRPWMGVLPVGPSAGMLLVRATLELRDASRYPGFVTPAFNEDLGALQPQIFVGDRRFGFWGGIFGVPSAKRQELYAALRKGPGEIFPLRFSADADLATGVVAGHVDGFYRRSRELQIEF